MQISVLLFVYNRSYHTKKVIESLKENTLLPQKIFIFQDGLKVGENAEEWEKVNILVNNIDWCDKSIIVSKNNKGLANSIVSGIDYVFKEGYDAVIILEDDCVTAPNYIRFMTQCFEKYADKEKIYSVSGYSWPIKLSQKDSDIYFCGRTCSWGWGTWKNRWEYYEKDYLLYKKLREEETKSKQLALWGNDLENTIVGNVTGKTNSWGIFWALKVIEQNGLCINPYKSLISNIGMDGTGVHCNITDRFLTELDLSKHEEYRLEENLEVLEEVKIAFASLYGSYTALNETNLKKEKVCIYGLGNFFFKKEKEINEEYSIEAFIDNGKKGYYAGKPIFSLKDIRKIKENSIILIMIQDINECMKIYKELIREYNISVKRIKLGIQKYEVYHKVFGSFRICEDGRLEISF